MQELSKVVQNTYKQNTIKYKFIVFNKQTEAEFKIDVLGTGDYIGVNHVVFHV